MTDTLNKHLETILTKCEKDLPKWQYILLKSAVLSDTDTQSAQRLEAMEKLYLQKQSEASLSDNDLKSMLFRLNRLFASQKKRGKDYKNTLSRADRVIKEMKKRGLKPKGGCVAACKKGLIEGTPNGGMHAHGIKRLAGKTHLDGDHTHAYKLPGSDEVYYTDVGGGHEHALGSNETSKTANDGKHSHSLYTEKFAEVLSTRLGGQHNHTMMIETTGFDGNHQHELVMPDGTVVLSLTAQEEFDALGMKSVPSKPIYSAFEISTAIQTAAYLQEKVSYLESLLAQDDFMLDGSMDDPMMEDFSFDQPMIKTLDFKGPENAKVVFVAEQPTPLEMARGEALSGPNKEIFVKKYLKLLKLNIEDVAIGFVNPTDQEIEEKECLEYLVKRLEIYKDAKIIALGKKARKALKKTAHCSLPHPTAVRKNFNSGEVSRKLRMLKKELDAGSSVGDDVIGSKNVGIDNHSVDPADLKSTGDDHQIGVSKSASEKQIVYGVVLDPYQVDLHNDWIPPNEIESTAHDFLSKSRVVGFEHKGEVSANVVESWVETYPTKEDHKKAMANEPHAVFKRSFGNDKIHSGAWIIGVKLPDDLWQMHKSGTLNAFSIGGFSIKSETEKSEMPDIRVIELQEAK